MDQLPPMVLHEHDVAAESWNDATRGTLTFRTLFGGPASRTGQFTAGVAADLEPGEWLGLHSHEQAEIYYVFQGELLLQLDGAEHPLRAGGPRCLSPTAQRTVSRTSAAHRDGCSTPWRLAPSTRWSTSSSGRYTAARVAGCGLSRRNRDGPAVAVSTSVSTLPVAQLTTSTTAQGSGHDILDTLNGSGHWPTPARWLVSNAPIGPYTRFLVHRNTFGLSHSGRSGQYSRSRSAAFRVSSEGHQPPSSASGVKSTRTEQRHGYGSGFRAPAAGRTAAAVTVVAGAPAPYGVDQRERATERYVPGAEHPPVHRVPGAKMATAECPAVT